MLSLNLGVRNLFISEEKVKLSLEFTCIQPYTPAQLAFLHLTKGTHPSPLAQAAGAIGVPQVTAS